MTSRITYFHHNGYNTSIVFNLLSLHEDINKMADHFSENMELTIQHSLTEDKLAISVAGATCCVATYGNSLSEVVQQLRSMINKTIKDYPHEKPKSKVKSASGSKGSKGPGRKSATRKRCDGACKGGCKKAGRCKGGMQDHKQRVVRPKAK